MSRGALLGLAVGDALGAPLEGAPRGLAAAAVADGLEMAGGGRWAPGEWTDDTALALELAESIASLGMLDTDDLGDRYIRWAATSGKGIGHTTRRALCGAAGAPGRHGSAWAARAQTVDHLKLGAALDVVGTARTRSPDGGLARCATAGGSSGPRTG